MKIKLTTLKQNSKFSIETKSDLLDKIFVFIQIFLKLSLL